MDARLSPPGNSLLALIIPALNEEQAIGGVLASLPLEWFSQILVADNGSTDRTAWIAGNAGAEVVREARRGYGSACLAALARLQPEIEIVVFMDGDASDDPADLPAIVEPILRGEAELVIGSRTLGRSEPGALTRQQRLGNWLATRFINWCYGVRFTDLGPFRAIRRDALERLRMADRDYGWTVEMQVKAARQPLRVVEVPVHYRPRVGRSKISRTIKGSILAGMKILWTVLRYRLLS
ncbi:MAG TPA: glycosyltransferase family 2 protein [Candidatus Acidoferrales bacterium]